MYKPSEIEIRVKGGFPVIAHLEWFRAEPDVGFPNPYYEVIELTTLRGKDAKFLRVDDSELYLAIERALA